MVNIKGKERAKLMEMYKNQGVTLALDVDTFDDALNECIKVMELDVFPKFLKFIKKVKEEGISPATTPRMGGAGSKGTMREESGGGSKWLLNNKPKRKVASIIK